MNILTSKKGLQDKILQVSIEARKINTEQLKAKKQVVEGFYGQGEKGKKAMELKPMLKDLNSEVKQIYNKLEGLMTVAQTYGFTEKEMERLKFLRDWAHGDWVPESAEPKGLYSNITTN